MTRRQALKTALAPLLLGREEVIVTFYGKLTAADHEIEDCGCFAIDNGDKKYSIGTNDARVVGQLANLRGNDVRVGIYGRREP